jgi:hypothetical protein
MLNVVDEEIDNAFLRRKKKSVRNKFKPTQSKTIEEANLLCVWLIVVGRKREAYDLLKSYATEIPYDEFRWERWEATCKAILLLSYLEQEKGNIEQSNRLNSIVLNQDYVVGDHYEDRRKLFWEHVKGYNSVPGMIEPCALKHNDLCIIYAEHFQEFMYFEQLKSHISEFSDSDRVMLTTVINENREILSDYVLNRE